MARKGLEVPPAASSSEEEEDIEEEEEEEVARKPNAGNQLTAGDSDDDDDDEDDDDDDDDDKEEKSDPKKSKNPPPVKDSKSASKNPKSPPRSGKPNTQESDSEGSDTESDSGHTPPSPSISDFAIKAHDAPAKPTTTSSSQKTKKLTAVANEKPPTAPKRSAETVSHGDDKDSKSKLKKAKISSPASENGGGGDEGAGVTEKKSMINRLWSEDDEVAILKGLIDFKSQKGTDPVTDKTGFYEFVKNYLSVDSSLSQLNDKVRRLKKKYTTYLKAAVNGEDPIISKPHEYKCFLLSKKVWDGPDAPGIGGKSKSKTKTPETPAKPKSSRKRTEPETANVTPVSKQPKEKESSVKKQQLLLLEEPPKTTKDEVPATSKSEVPATTTKDEVKEATTTKDVAVVGFSELYPFLSDALKMSPQYPLFGENGIKIFEQNTTSIGETKLNALEEKCKMQKIAEGEVSSGRLLLTNEINQNLVEAMKSSQKS